MPPARLERRALAVAPAITAMSLPSVIADKTAINGAHQGGLREGVLSAGRALSALFAMRDLTQRMSAFLEKRGRFQARLAAC